MIRSMGLARVDADASHIDGLHYGLDDARIAAGLKAGGLAAALYPGQSIGRVQDLTRQLARMRTDGFLLWTCPEALSVSRQLSLGLKQFRPAVRILWWGPGLLDALSRHIAEGAAELLPAAVADEVISSPMQT